MPSGHPAAHSGTPWLFGPSFLWIIHPQNLLGKALLCPTVAPARPDGYRRGDGPSPLPSEDGVHLKQWHLQPSLSHPSPIPSPPSTPSPSPFLPGQPPPGTQRSSRAGGSHVAWCSWAIASSTDACNSAGPAGPEVQSPFQKQSGLQAPTSLFFKPCCPLFGFFSFVPGAGEKMAEEQTHRWVVLQTPGPRSVGTSSEEPSKPPALPLPSHPKTQARRSHLAQPVALWFPLWSGESPWEEQGPWVCPMVSIRSREQPSTSSLAQGLHPQGGTMTPESLSDFSSWKPVFHLAWKVPCR